jgi:DNA-binding NarL/FixJ family response regulator
LVADDHPEILIRVRSLLAVHFVVVGTATDSRQLIAAAADAQADVLVVDVCMPGMGGLEALAVIREGGSRVPAVCVSASAEADVIEAAWAAGASAYVAKPALAVDLVPAIRAALDNRRFLSPSLDPTRA